jgi:steroid delta-isomerase-like uncharacterized protein
MSKENNIAIQQKFGEAVNTGNLEVLRTLVADTCIEHDPAPEQKPGAQGYIDFFTTMRTAFPDFQIKVVNLVADDESVAFAYSASGTHAADFMGLPPTGKTFEVRGMQISRFENGKMVERWGSSDELGILKQLGATVS